MNFRICAATNIRTRNSYMYTKIIGNYFLPLKYDEEEQDRPAARRRQPPPPQRQQPPQRRLRDPSSSVSEPRAAGAAPWAAAPWAHVPSPPRQSSARGPCPRRRGGPSRRAWLG